VHSIVYIPSAVEEVRAEWQGARRKHSLSLTEPNNAANGPAPPQPLVARAIFGSCRLAQTSRITSHRLFLRSLPQAKIAPPALGIQLIPCANTSISQFNNSIELVFFWKMSPITKVSQMPQINSSARMLQRESILTAFREIADWQTKKDSVEKEKSCEKANQYA
jgi:hypothetical protein